MPITGEDALCPSNFTHGKIVWHCSRQAGDTCTYSCNTGCTESSVSWLRCQDDGTWDTNTDELCNCKHTKHSLKRLLLVRREDLIVSDSSSDIVSCR